MDGAAGGLTNNGLTLTTNSVVITAELSTPNATDLTLEVTTNFAPSTGGLNNNQASVGSVLNSALEGGSLSTLTTALTTASATNADLAAGLEQLSPGAVLSGQAASLGGAVNFIGNMFSCRSMLGQMSYTKEGKEGECLWLRPSGRLVKHTTTTNSVGYKSESASLSGGMQVAIAPGWHAGLVLGYEYTDLKSSTKVKS